MRCQLGLGGSRVLPVTTILVIRTVLLVFGLRILLDSLYGLQAFLLVQVALLVSLLDEFLRRFSFRNLELDLLCSRLLELILFPGLLYHFRFLVLYFLF